MKWFSLISEDQGKNISIGRITTLVLTLTLFYYWFAKQFYLGYSDITLEEIKLADELFKLPAGLLESFITSLGYNSFKKLNITKNK